MSSDSSAGWRMGGMGPGLPVLLLLVFANFLRTDQTALRPPVQRAERPIAHELENLPTQLWRDPLGAVYAELARAPKEAGEGLFGSPKPVGLERFREVFQEHAARSGPAVHVVAMLVPGGSRPEDIELRVRHRHAMVAAFGAYGLNAQATDRIGFVRAVPLPRWDDSLAQRDRVGPAALEDEGDTIDAVVERSDVDGLQVLEAATAAASCSEPGLERGAVLPFEWYEGTARTSSGADASGSAAGERGRSAGARALVVWLDEDVLGEHPLFSTYYLLEQLLPTPPQTAVRLHVVGPSNSETLHRMLADDRRIGTTPSAWTDPRVISPRSTVSPATLYRAAGIEADAGTDLEFVTATFERTIGTDAELARLLVEELAARLHRFRPEQEVSTSFAVLRAILRGVGFEPPRQTASIRVGLVTEGDTNYGRAWERLLEDAADGLNADRRASRVLRWAESLARRAADELEDAAGGGAAEPWRVRELYSSEDEFERLVADELGEPEDLVDGLWRRLLIQNRMAFANLRLDRVRHDVDGVRWLAGSLGRGLHERLVEEVVDAFSPAESAEPSKSATRPEPSVSRSLTQGRGYAGFIADHLEPWVSVRIDRVRNRVRAGELEDRFFESLEVELRDRSVASLQRARESSREQLEEVIADWVADGRQEPVVVAVESLLAQRFAQWLRRAPDEVDRADVLQALHDGDLDEELRVTLDQQLERFARAESSVAGTPDDLTFAADLSLLVDGAIRRCLSAWWSDYDFDFVPAARYLRGIDGRVAGDERAPVEPGQEPAIGEAQLDYVRRLKQLFEGQQFHAIGVLGNDVYDKLSLLAVLRPLFRSSLFFTTDLDARLLPSRANQATLNLIVASHYGLVLDPLHQEGHPPFRSGYQASVYLAAHRAAAGIVSADHHPAVIDAERSAGRDSRELARAEDLRRRLELQAQQQFIPRGRLFETGRTWFHPLAAPELDGSATVWATAADRRDAERCIDANLSTDDTPQAWLFEERHTLGVLVCLVLVALCFGQSDWIRSRCGGFLADLGRPHRWFTFGVVIPAALVGLYALFGRMQTVGQGAGEPFRIVEGISVWPTIWIRVGVVAICHLGWLAAIVKVKRFTREARARWFGVRSRDRSAVAAAWQSFERATRTRNLTIWAVIATIVYYVGTSAAFAFLGGDMAPTRGEEGYLLERFVLFVSVVWLVLLLAWIFRLMLAGRVLIRALGAIEPEAWPPAVLERVQEERGLGRTAAARALPTLVAEAIGRELNGLIWFPALAMFGMVVSRASLFDSWGWPPALIFTLALSFLLTLLSGHHVRRAAIDERQDALQHLLRLRQRSSSDAEEGQRLGWLIEELQGLRTGAFAPIVAHPLLRAWLLPIAGLGTNSILEVMLPTVVGYAG